MQSRATEIRRLGLAIVAACCAIVPTVALWMLMSAKGADQDSLQLGMVFAIITVIASALLTIAVYGWAVRRVTDAWTFDDIRDLASIIVGVAAFIGLAVTDSPLLLAGILASIVGMRGGMKQINDGLDLRPIGRL